MEKILEIIPDDNLDGVKDDPPANTPRCYVAGLPVGLGKPTPIEDPITTEQIASYINRTKRLTDDAYEELVHDIGWRVAMLVLRHKAWSGDVRALDVYIRIAHEAKNRKRKPAAKDARDVTPADQFKPGSRPKTDKEA
jgi:hypothetical protein